MVEYLRLAQTDSGEKYCSSLTIFAVSIERLINRIECKSRYLLGIDRIRSDVVHNGSSAGQAVG